MYFGKDVEYAMNSVIAILCIIINGSFEKDTDYRIALFILEHIHEMRSLSMSAIASSCLTSPATVKRFIRMLGHSNYSGFLFQIENSLGIREKQMAERFENTDLNDLIQKALTIYPDMDADMLKESVVRMNDSIHSSPRVYILGAAYPGALAVNYQEDMFLLNKPVLIQPVIPSILNDLDGINEDDYVILATVSGSLYRLNPMRENALKQFRNMAVITAESTDTSSFKDALTIRLPQTKDDEKYNWFLMIFWQMMKHDHYERYGMRR